MGGNPEAAELAGINTRWVTMKIFILMGMLCAIAGAISTARLNASTNAQGTLDELLVIAAAVIGGTSLSGGIGTIAGAMIGALVMQSLQSGMVLLGVDAPLAETVVEMQDCSISFGGIHAVDNASLSLRKGEVVALLGHNGAGKSTFIKLLSGAYRRDAGVIRIRGEEANINNPRDAKAYGIETIYQTLALADSLMLRF